MKNLTIPQALDLIPLGGCALMPGLMAGVIRMETAKRNRRLGGEEYIVTVVAELKGDYVMVERREAWDIAREDIVANSHRYYKTNSWQLA